MFLCYNMKNNCLYSAKINYWIENLEKESFRWRPLTVLPFSSLAPRFPPSRLTQGDLNSCGWWFFQAFVTLTIIHKSDEFTSIDWLDLVDVESRWGIDQLFSLLLNWLMGEISTNIWTTILYLCKTIWKFKTVYHKIGATILYEDNFIITQFKIFPEINRFKNVGLAWKTL